MDMCPELVEGQCVARVCAPSLSKGTEMSLVPAPVWQRFERLRNKLPWSITS
jgi:hypothetical protein